MKMKGFTSVICWSLLYLVQCVCGDGGVDWQSSYDYIVVGSGAGGSVVASRLSEDRHISVLLLEAGGKDNDPFMRIPAAFPAVYTNPEYDWGYVTEPQQMSPSNASIAWTQGKVLGGSTSVNGMMYVRGSRHDFDHWAQMGNYNWSYEAVLPYFKKSEMMTSPDLEFNGYHGRSGPMQTRVVEKVPLHSAFAFAAGNVGLEENEDFNSMDLEGIGMMQAMVDKRGERASTYQAFIKPILGRWNLKVLTSAMVTKLSFDMQSAFPTVNGVYFTREGMEYMVKANREVIVCAGAIGSPALLLRSGIGPKQHLESLGIPVVQDLPVGENLQDHTYFPYVFELNSSTPIRSPKLFNFESFFNQIFVGKGPLADQASSIAFLKTSIQPEEDKFPHLQFIMSTPGFHLPSSAPQALYYVQTRQKLPQEIAQVLQGVDHTFTNVPIIIIPTVLHSSTRGRVSLRSPDPTVNPKIEYNYLSNHEDVKQLIEGIRFAQSIANTTVMKELFAQVSHDSHPNCGSKTYDSDSYWECVLYNSLTTGWHYGGTCKMAPGTAGVVDDRLRVKGVFGLRVADASIMPVLPSGNTAAATIMIGEKAADMIKADEFMHFLNSSYPSSGSSYQCCNSMFSTILIAEFVMALLAATAFQL